MSITKPLSGRDPSRKTSGKSAGTGTGLQGQRLVEEVASHDHPLRDLFKDGAGWVWLGSLMLHLIILVGMGIIYFQTQSDIDIETVLDFTEPDEFGVGPDVETQLMDFTPSDAMSSVTVLGTPDPILAPIDVGISSLSETGTIRAAGGNEGDLGRVGEIDRRVAAGGGETAGRLRISLAWEDMNDLDLHVITPDHEHIYYANRRSGCGGELDIDANVQPTTREPVENIVWMNDPRDGTYHVVVHHFARHDGQPANSRCDLLIIVGEDKRVVSFRGLRPRQDVELATFRIEQGRLAEFESHQRASDGSEGSSGGRTPLVFDEKREEQRRQFAQEALTEALAIQDARTRAGRLRAVVRRFPSTPAAEQAQQLLDQM